MRRLRLPWTTKTIDGSFPTTTHSLRPISACNGNVVFISDFDEPLYSSCQKLLFSATLTSNPSKIAELNLRDAKWFVVKGKSEDVDVPTLLDEGFELPLGLRVRRGNVYLTSRYANLAH